MSSIQILAPVRCCPLNCRLIPNAFVSLPGPEVIRLVDDTSMRCIIVVVPARGSKARMRTASPIPAPPVTTLKR